MKIDTTGNSKVIVGLGQTGMSCARYFAANGEQFVVADSREHPPLLEQFREEFPSVPLLLGEFTDATFASASELVMSPGVSLKDAAIARAVSRGVAVTGDIDIFSKLVDAPIIAVTGSNGKSTVVGLLAEILSVAGIDFGLGGNLDGVHARPALSLLGARQRDMYVLELSSFQLETTQRLNAEVAVILNLTEDHMDRYDSLESYLQAKQRIFKGCQCAVVNVEEAGSRPPETDNIRIVEYGGEGSSTDYCLSRDGDRDYLMCEGDKLVAVDELRITQGHNISNMLAATAIARALDISPHLIAAALREFQGLPNRCQWVAEIGGVSFYNDSKGTNVGAAVAAVEGLGKRTQGKIVLIAGGVGKGADFRPLGDVVEKWCRAVILIGRDRGSIDSVLSDDMSRATAGDMNEAVTLAQKFAEPGDIILLSPACASFDMYRDFNHRGQVFMEIVGAKQ